MPEDAASFDERQLVARACRGDGPALARLWRENRGWVAALLFAGAPRGDLEDLCQEVAMRLCGQIHSLRDPAAFRGWLRTVSRNVAQTALRDKQKNAPVSPLHDVGDPLFDDERAEQRDEAASWLARIDGLPSDYREPLLMRCVEGMTQKAIAAALDLPETTVETRLARARRMLRQAAVCQTAPVESISLRDRT